MATAIQKQINKSTGVNRRNKNKASARNARNTFRRKSSGGMGG